jgi:catechol 2,3-dioxygenase-like lactoylglutathione lyase family enzyme
MVFLFAVLSTCFSFGESRPLKAADKEFARTTIDLGVVVSDVDRAVEFYTKAIGFQEIEGFAVDGDFAGGAGLTDNQPLKIRVLVLGKDETATKLKLMQVSGVETKPADNRFIHSQFGFSYLTIFVVDTNAALTRLKEAGVKPLAKGPVALPASLAEGVFLTVVRDPDGNFIELVGPKQ